MYRLVRIEGLHNFVPNQHLNFVLYNGTEYKTVSYKILQGSDGHCFLQNKDSGDNAIIFSLLNIRDKIHYCKQFSDVYDGCFPEHSSLKNLEKTIFSFFELNKTISIPSKYKVGDKVIVGERNGCGKNYPYNFADEMVNPGKVLTITAVNNIINITNYKRKYFEEPYYYFVREDSYSWSSFMFSGLVESSKLQIISIKKVNSNNWNVHLSNGENIKLSLEGSGYLKNHNVVFYKFISYDNLSLFLERELTCICDFTGYEPFIDKVENIWVFIDHLKYKFGTEECKKTINPEFYKFLKNPPTTQEIIQQTNYLQQKTQGNAYQFQRRKSTVRAGDVPEGNRICGKRSKASVSSRPLSYRKGVGY